MGEEGLNLLADDSGIDLLEEFKPAIKETTKQVIEEKAAEPGLFGMREPTKDVDWGSIGTQTLAGGVIGSVFPVLGTFGGATAGFTSAFAGEVSKLFGAPSAVQFGVELVGGELPAITKKLGTESVNLIGRTAVNKGNIWKSIKDSFSFDSKDAQNIIKAKESIFGKDFVEASIASNSKNSITLQKLLKEELNIPNVDIKASTYYRGKLLNTLEEYSQNGQKFMNSSSGKALFDDFDNLAKELGIPKSEFTQIKNILRNQLSDNPEVAKKAFNNMLNIMQSGSIKVGSKEGKLVNVKVLKDEHHMAALESMKKRMDEFLQTGAEALSKGGGPRVNLYNKLKEIERLEYIAEVRDLIPTILGTKFDMGSDAFKRAVQTLSSKGDDIPSMLMARDEFRKATMQHFKNLGETLFVKQDVAIPFTNIGKSFPSKGSSIGSNTSIVELEKELLRLQEPLAKMNVISAKEMDLLIKDVAKMKSKIRSSGWSNFWKNRSIRAINNTLSMSVTGTVNSFEEEADSEMFSL